jgi:hypothetical protein
MLERNDLMSEKTHGPQNARAVALRGVKRNDYAL